jgi:hypothetical protein
MYHVPCTIQYLIQFLCFFALIRLHFVAFSVEFFLYRQHFPSLLLLIFLLFSCFSCLHFHNVIVGKVVCDGYFCSFYWHDTSTCVVQHNKRSAHVHWTAIHAKDFGSIGSQDLNDTTQSTGRRRRCA